MQWRIGNSVIFIFASGVTATLLVEQENFSWVLLSLCAGLWLLFLDTIRPLHSASHPLHFPHAKTRQLSQQLPPPYPNGWYLLLYSFELVERGQVKSVRALGREFAVWRDQTSGKVSVFNAYCPHLGANLAVDGEVKDNCLVCPFHGWKFPACDGTQSISSNQNEVYLCVERNEMILIWLDGKRDASRRGRGMLSAQAQPECPSWQVPETYSQEKFPQFVGLVDHTISAHICEIPENGADFNHLKTVHGQFVIPFLSSVLDHNWDFTWTPNSDHTATVKMNLGLRVKPLGNWLVESLAVRVHVVQTGPSLVFEQLTLPLGMGTLYFSSSVTPISPLKLRYTHTMWCSDWMPRFVAKLVLRGLQAQVNRDVPIWNNKIYRAKPRFTPADGTKIAEFRKWFSQFYVIESETFAEAMEAEKWSMEF